MGSQLLALIGFAGAIGLAGVILYAAVTMIHDGLILDRLPCWTEWIVYHWRNIHSRKYFNRSQFLEASKVAYQLSRHSRLSSRAMQPWKEAEGEVAQLREEAEWHKVRTAGLDQKLTALQAYSQAVSLAQKELEAALKGSESEEETKPAALAATPKESTVTLGRQ